MSSGPGTGAGAGAGAGTSVGLGCLGCRGGFGFGVGADPFDGPPGDPCASIAAAEGFLTRFLGGAEGVPVEVEAADAGGTEEDEDGHSSLTIWRLLVEISTDKFPFSS
jgi:hypothetical protein